MGYSAVLYYHGIGNQRRYEELCRLVESLERSNPVSPDSEILYELESCLEPGRKENEHDTAFIRGKFGRPATDDCQRFRFYEVYWAPLTAGGFSAWRMLCWSIRQLAKGLLHRNRKWCLRQRLRRSSFLNLINSTSRKDKNRFQAGDPKLLLKEYSRYSEAVGSSPGLKGNFREFTRHLKSSYSQENQDHVLARLLKLTRLWRRHDRRLSLRMRFVCISVLLFVFSLILGSCVAIFNGLSQFPRIEPRPAAWMGAILAVICLIRHFLKHYLGDIKFWTTYEETDVKHKKRKEILDLGFHGLMQLLLDPECERVVVVAHSLGSAIAYDSLLKVGRYQRARPDCRVKLDKIEAFVTLGSPIDKIHWFFERYQSQNPRYRRVVEEIRGDIGELPFWNGKSPVIYWLNLWDRADPISGSLETPASAIHQFLHIDNVHVNFPSPVPFLCHSRYLHSGEVQHLLREVIFHHHNPYRNKARECRFLGPGRFKTIANLPGILSFITLWTTTLVVVWLIFLR